MKALMRRSGSTDSILHLDHILSSQECDSLYSVLDSKENQTLILPNM